MQIKHSSSILALFAVSVAVSVSFPGKSGILVDGRPISDSSLPTWPAMSGSGGSLYLVYTKKPAGMVDPESAYLRILQTVLGSEKAAKEALIYVYTNAATGFSAKLTPKQASQIQRQPRVLYVVRTP